MNHPFLHVCNVAPEGILGVCEVLPGYQFCRNKKKLLPRKLLIFMINCSLHMHVKERNISRNIAPKSRVFAYSLLSFAKMSGVVHTLKVVNYCKLHCTYCIGELCSVCPG